MSYETIAIETSPAAPNHAESSGSELQDRVISGLRNRRVRRAIGAGVIGLAALLAIYGSGGSGTSLAAWCQSGRNAPALTGIFSGDTPTPALMAQGASEMQQMIASAPGQVPAQVKADMQTVETVLAEGGSGQPMAVSESTFTAAAMAVQSWSTSACPASGQ